MGVRLGFTASAEQFDPRELLEISVMAERRGFEMIAVSDRFQPRRHHGGHAPAVLPWLGALTQATEQAVLGTSAMVPMLRHHPSILAQSFATLDSLAPGRLFLGIGTGEAMNEVPATGSQLPPPPERRMRMVEAVALMRRLWTEERVDFDGDYYRTEKATVYDRPQAPIPVYLAAPDPAAARLAGRMGDGVICTSGEDPALYGDLLDNVAVGAQQAGRDMGEIRRVIEVRVSYDSDIDYARTVCGFWAGLALSSDEKTGIDDPLDRERVADANVHRAHTRFIVSDDREAVAAQIRSYVDLGFQDVVIHAPGHDQGRFLQQFSDDVMPLLRAMDS